MTYRILASQLYEVANESRRFCTEQWGIRRAKINVEQPIDNELGFVPTLSATTSDAYLVCIEVSTRVYSPTLDAFVLACKNRGMAVKLYVAVPRDSIEG